MTVVEDLKLELDQIGVGMELEVVETGAVPKIIELVVRKVLAVETHKLEEVLECTRS